jgi:hypothetical protein
MPAPPSPNWKIAGCEKTLVSNHLTGIKRQELNTLFSMNRRLLKAYLLKESLDRLWFYRYEGAMLRYLQSWMAQLH